MLSGPLCALLCPPVYVYEHFIAGNRVYLSRIIKMKFQLGANVLSIDIKTSHRHTHRTHNGLCKDVRTANPVTKCQEEGEKKIDEK